MTASPSGFERIAHRGSPRERTENTLPGFLLALDHGADAVELDVHVSADGVVVVHHDPDVGGQPIGAQPWSRLRDAELPGGAEMPRLDDVLAAIGSRGFTYVELKGLGIEAAVAAVIGESGAPCAMHSFDHAAIARCARSHPHIPRGILLDRDTPHPAMALARALPATRPRDVWPHFSLVDERFMEAARAHELRVIPWTVNDHDAASVLVRLGVAGVCTDDVRLLLRLR